MRKKKALFLLGILAGLCFGCGKKGPIVPPVLKLPQKVQDFKVLQQGARIILSWQNPTAYTDGSPLEAIAGIEIWLVDSDLPDAVPVTAGEFPSRAARLQLLETEEFVRIPDETSPDMKNLSFPIEIKPSDFGAKRFTFGIRVLTGRRRKSAFSDPVSVEPRLIPRAPGNIRARIHADRIELEWDAPEKNIDDSTPAVIKGYFVYRTVPEGNPIRMNEAPLDAPRLEDRDIVFGRSYAYTVRATAVDVPPFAESDPAPEIRVEVKDTFPPQPPQGVIAIVGRDFVALSWEANRESDLMGYRVWRKCRGEQEFVPLKNEPVPENAYTDRTIAAVSDCVYAVTAVDQEGNESRISNEVQVHIEGDVNENLSF